MKVQWMVTYWCAAAILVACAAMPATASGILRSALDRPDRPDPVFISAGATLGGSPDWDTGTVGFNASILFRPTRAAEFSPSLFHWNTGLVVDGEWRPLAERRTAWTADVIFRRYLSDLKRARTGAVLFAGIGGGLALISYPAFVAASTADGETAAAATVTTRDQRWWSVVTEFGYEAQPAPDVLITAKARWRSYIKRPFDYSSWTVHLLVGIPIPW